MAVKVCRMKVRAWLREAHYKISLDRYNASASSTYKQLDGNWTIKYGDGSRYAAGKIAEDKVCVSKS